MMPCRTFEREPPESPADFQDRWRERLTKAVIAHVVHVYEMTGKKMYLVRSPP